MTETTSEQYQLDAVDKRGNGVRVEFFHAGDRYAHRIFRLSEGEADLVLKSIEGSDKDEWPTTPPLQQFSLENQGNGRDIAFGVGMAGRSHWSLAVDGPEDRPGLRFEAACRAHSRPAELGSSYQLHGGASLEQHADQILIVVGDRVMLTFTAADCELRVEADRCQIAPMIPPGDYPQTVTWSYEIHLQASEA